MLDLAQTLRTKLTSAAEDARERIETASRGFMEAAIEAVMEFNAQTEMRLQLLAQGSPKQDEADREPPKQDPEPSDPLPANGIPTTSKEQEGFLTGWDEDGVAQYRRPSTETF